VGKAVVRIRQQQRIAATTPLKVPYREMPRRG
jgi:hypothetical protein